MKEIILKLAENAGMDIQEDNDGQLVIYTGLYALPDIEDLDIEEN